MSKMSCITAARSSRSSAYHTADAKVPQMESAPHVPSSPPPMGPFSPAHTCDAGARRRTRAANHAAARG